MIHKSFHSNVVTRFGHASYYVGRNLANQGKSLEEKYYVKNSLYYIKKMNINIQTQISEKDYATHGGAFPLIIKNVGVVGTITVSGLAQQVT